MDASYQQQFRDLEAVGANVRMIDKADLDKWIDSTNQPAVQSKWVSEQEANGVTGMTDTHRQIDAIMQNYLEK